MRVLRVLLLVFVLLVFALIGPTSSSSAEDEEDVIKIAKDVMSEMGNLWGFTGEKGENFNYLPGPGGTEQNIENWRPQLRLEKSGSITNLDGSVAPKLSYLRLNLDVPESEDQPGYISNLEEELKLTGTLMDGKESEYQGFKTGEFTAISLRDAGVDDEGNEYPACHSFYVIYGVYSEDAKIFIYAGTMGGPCLTEDVRSLADAEMWDIKQAVHLVIEKFRRSGLFLGEEEVEEPATGEPETGEGLTTDESLRDRARDLQRLFDEELSSAELRHPVTVISAEPRGNVRISYDGVKWEPMTRDDTDLSDVFLHTADGGKLTVETSGGTLYAREGSFLHIRGSETVAIGGQVLLLDGVVRLLANLEVLTEWAEIVPIFTEFEVAVDEKGTTTVRTFKGQVRVTDRAGKGQVIVSSGFMTTVEKGKAPTEPRKQSSLTWLWVLLPILVLAGAVWWWRKQRKPFETSYKY